MRDVIVTQESSKTAELANFVSSMILCLGKQMMMMVTSWEWTVGQLLIGKKRAPSAGQLPSSFLFHFDTPTSLQNINRPCLYVLRIQLMFMVSKFEISTSLF
jgi:hypothetical protein